MGTVQSKDTRRISFNNTFAISSALVVPKAIEDDNVLNLDAISAVTEKNDDLLFPDTKVKEIAKEESELDYWANRIESLKKEHRMINKIIENEYEKTLEDTTKDFESPELRKENYEKIKPCFEWRAKIMQCYEDNRQQPLVCSPIVQAFSDCVTSCRIND